MNLLRHAVSKQKRRFVDKEAGLDLDLAYITPSLIAMGFPSNSLEAFYRNPMSDVEKFLDARHEGAYKVYNLCSEKKYSDQRFHGRVAQFPFPDHSPPPFQLIHPLCEDVSDWLHTTAGNVVAIHCKAGKGRTGVMICAFLVHCGATAAEAIKLYGEKRTLDGCGVTIPSQIRYIHYYEQFLECRTLNYDPRLLSLHEIIMDTIPKPLLGIDPGNNYLILTIMSGEVKIYESLPQHCHVDHKLQQIRISITDKIVLAGDVKMMLWYDSLYKRCHLCHFHFNTTFIDPYHNTLSLRKSEIDKACKDKLHSILDKDMHVRVQFSPALAQQSPLPTLDSLPNRAILLKYKNHNGPNSVEISPPYYSSLKLSPPRNKSALPIFGLGAVSTSATTAGNEEETSQRPSSSSPNSSGFNVSSSSSSKTTPSTPAQSLSPSAKTALRSDAPVLIHSSKSSFKPVWNDKDRDRDNDNWDASSISSDLSELDTEWWYTKPPRPTIHSSAGTAAGTASASIVQPEIIVRTDPETKGLIFAGAQEDNNGSCSSSHHSNGSNKVDSQYSSPPISPLSPHFRPLLTSTNINTISAMPVTSVLPSPPSSAYRSPPHSASSPLAREVIFDTETTMRMTAIKSLLACPSLDVDGTTRVSKEHAMRSKWEAHDGVHGGTYLNEEPVTHGGERDSGVESIDSREQSDRYRERDREREREGEGERERGWVDSVSRWFWHAEGSPQGPQVLKVVEQQEPNGTERQ